MELSRSTDKNGHITSQLRILTENKTIISVINKQQNCFPFLVTLFYCISATYPQNVLPEMVSVNSVIIQQNIQTKPTDHQGMECGHCPEREITVTRRYCHSQPPSCRMHPKSRSVASLLYATTNDSFDVRWERVKK